MLNESIPDTLKLVRCLLLRRLGVPLGTGLLGLALTATGCSKKQQPSATTVPGTSQAGARRVVVAEPAPRQDVYVERSIRYDSPSAQYPEAVGYDELSTGEQVVIVEYVHTYPDEIETFPQVAWAGRTYYNVHGDFVYWADGWGWCYYLGPPAPLVVAWNGYYPWAPYSWGVGYYGPGWYWGGVGMYGYHAYGLSVVHHDHHHHHYHQYDRQPGRDPRPSRHADAEVPTSGLPTGPTQPIPTGAGKRTNPSGGSSRSGGGSKATRTNPGRFTGTTPTRRNPAPKVADAGAVRTNPGSRRPSGVRTNPGPAIRTNGYTTAGGQRVTVVDPRGTSTSPAVRRRPTTIGRVPPGSAPTRTNRPPSDPSFTARPRPVRTNTKSTTSPTRARPKAQPTRKPQPSWGSSYANKPRAQPKRTAPKRSAPPQRTAPTRSAPRRSSTPVRSAPKRSAPVRSAPRRSAPTRSAPKRSAPTRSAPKRSAPTRSAPKRSRGR